MIIYTHKVRQNIENGWGKSLGMSTEVLGRYSTKEKAVEAKEKRDKSIDNRYYDIGHSWIEEEKVE